MSASPERLTGLHLILDFGGVLTTSQPADTLRRLATIAGADLHPFSEQYWRLRDAYDRGLPAAEYWGAVLPDRRLPGRTVDLLTRTDISSWVSLDHESLDVAIDARAAGATLHLLSNAPHAQATYVRQHPLLRSIFDTTTFSCEVGANKPDRAIYEHTLRLVAPLGGTALFIDDRAENVDGALTAGLDAALFEGAAALRRLLDRWADRGAMVR